MILGRVMAAVANTFIFTQGGSFAMAAFITSYFVTSFPGIVIQIAFIPSVIYALESAGLIPKRYPYKKQTSFAAAAEANSKTELNNENND
jgi:hypothetical protein